jgi:hypothetical protein
MQAARLLRWNMRAGCIGACSACGRENVIFQSFPERY